MPIQPAGLPGAAADRILIEGLAFTGLHGWFAHERVEGCQFVVDATLTLDTRTAAASDRLRDTVDYGAVSALLVAVGTGESVRLLERLASLMADAILSDFTLVATVHLTLRKLAPAITGTPTAVGVTVSRSRGDAP